MGNRRKLKIGLSLLIALAFIVPTGAVMAGQPELIPKDGRGEASEPPAYIAPDKLKEASENFVIAGMIDKAGNPVIQQNPMTTVDAFILKDPNGDRNVVLGGDTIPTADYYDFIVKLTNPGPGTDVVEPEMELYQYSPGTSVELYGTSFEDNARNYMEWVQIDADSGIVGGYYDGWAWSDARACDGDHSFKSTMYDEYKNCQEDYLVHQKTYDVSDQYAVKVTFDIWVAGEYETWYTSFWYGDLYTPLDYLDFMIIQGDDPTDMGNWYYYNNGDGQYFADDAGYFMPGNYYFPDTSLPLYNIDDPGMTGKDYTHKAEKIDTCPGWWRVWVEIPVSILPDPEHFGILFGWHSDKERVHEGAYVDNVHIYSIEDVQTKIYQGHSQQWLTIDEGTTEFQFPLTWNDPAPGTYKAILKVKNDEGGYDDYKEIVFTIADNLDCEISDITVEDSFTGEEVPDGGRLTYTADAHIKYTYHQAGNVPSPEGGVPIKATGYKIEKDVLFQDDFEGPSQWVYFFEDYPLYISDKFAWSGSHSLALNNPETLHYDNNGLYIGYSQNFWSMEGVQEAYMDFYYKAALADSGDHFLICFTAYRYIIGFYFLDGPYMEDWVGPMQPMGSYFTIDVKNIFDRLVSYGYFYDDNGHMTYEMGLGFWLWTDSSGIFYDDEHTQWSGVYVDDITIYAKVLGDKVWEDSTVLDCSCEPSNTCEGQFEWEDVPYSEYAVTVEAACPDDVNPDNNMKKSTFIVLEDLERAWKPTPVDLTECTPEAWCISNIVGCEPDPDAYALATNCDTHDIPYGVNDYVTPTIGGDDCSLDISHIDRSGGRTDLLVEDFESGCPPAGWTIIDAGSDGCTWDCDTSVPSWASSWANAGATGTFMVADDDSCDGDESFEELWTPVIDCSAATGVTLTFDGYYNSLSSLDFFQVDVSNDGGITFNTVYYTDVDTDFSTLTPIDISAYADGQSSVIIRFVYGDNGHWAWGAIIDDVNVYASSGPTMMLDMDYQVDMYPYDVVYLEIAGYTTGSQTWTLEGWDDWGDGWDSDYDWLYDCFIDVFVNDVKVIDGFTTYWGYNVDTFDVMEGDVVKLVYYGTIPKADRLYEDEHSWRLTDADGHVLAEDGMGGAVPQDATFGPFNVGHCDGCPSVECPCPPGVEAWTQIASFTGNRPYWVDPCEKEHFSVNLLDYIDPAWDHICLRFRLDSTAYPYAPVPGIGFHIHDISIEGLFSDDFEDGDMIIEDTWNGELGKWNVGCVQYGAEWEHVADHEWCIDFPAEPVHTALVWSTEIEDAYEAYFFGEWEYSIGSGTTLYCELSTDGENWYIIDKIEGPASSGGCVPIEPYGFDLTPWAGQSIMIRVRVQNDGTYPSAGHVCVCDMTIAGKQDRTPPTATITLTGDLVAPGLYAGPVTATITAQDDHLVGEIHYILDGTETVVSGDHVTFTVSEDGSHTIEFWAVDSTGNEGAHSSVTFSIDATPPTVAITAPEPGFYLFGNKLFDMAKPFIIGAFNIQATADDAQGVAVVKFYLDGELIGESTEAPYGVYCAVKHMGSGTIKVVAFDGVGNSAEDTLDVTYYKFL